MLPDMKRPTMPQMNRKTARVPRAVQQGDVGLGRHGKAIGSITRDPPSPQRKPDWKAHFDWLKKQNTKNDAAILAEFEEERRRQAGF